MNEYGFSFIKSGFEDVSGDIQSDFEQFGVDTIASRAVFLGEKLIDYAYRDSLNEPFYPAMKDHLLHNRVIAMILHSRRGDSDGTLQDILYKLKYGLDGLPNLREKYAIETSRLSEDEIAAWYSGIHPAQAETTIKLTQNNVFHASDTSLEAAESLRILITTNAEFTDNLNLHDLRIARLLGRLGLAVLL